MNRKSKVAVQFATATTATQVKEDIQALTNVDAQVDIRNENIVNIELPQSMSAIDSSSSYTSDSEMDMDVWWLLSPSGNWTHTEKDNPAAKTPHLDRSTFKSTGHITAGGRNRGIEVGWLGDKLHVVVKKVAGNRWTKVPNASRGGINYRINLYQQYMYITQMCKTHQCKNIQRIYGVRFDEQASEHTVYAQYYKCGDAKRYIASHDNTIFDVCRMFLGAWNGLKELNQTLCLLHGDLSMGNIFVSDDGDGLIADLDSVLYVGPKEIAEKYTLVKCDKTMHIPWGTRCFGAPFDHCDIRRDQVALLLNTISGISTKLSPLSWPQFCANFLKSNDLLQKGGQSTFGYATNSEHKVDMDTKIYHNYITHISATNIKSDLLSDLLSLLNSSLSYKWDYHEVHNQVTQVLGKFLSGSSTCC